jgi:hypothetical protein
VIEQDGNNPSLAACRELGAYIIIGDAKDSLILRKAGVRRAKYLFAVTGEDGTNVEIAEQAQLLIEGHRTSVLTCVLHVTDGYLWTLLREKMFSKEQTSVFRTELFNVYDTGARILLRETLQKDADPSPHILIIGMGELAEHLILRAAQKWCINESQNQLFISIVYPVVNHRLEDLKIRYPLVNKACKFFPYIYQTNWPEIQTGAFIQLSETSHLITHAFICLDDTQLGLRVGFTLLRLLEDQKTQIMVRMMEDAGLAIFLKETKNTSLKNLSTFGLLDRTCGMGLFDDGTHEDLARVIHEHYFSHEIKKGLTAQDNPNILPWESLSEEIKESNRRQADHIGYKLAAIGHGMAVWRDYGKEKHVFKLEEIEKMAKMEHTRWYEEKVREGWTYGDKRDDDNKKHPDLVADWLDPRLTEEAREKDREAVELIPELLARAGFQIYRVNTRN